MKRILLFMAFLGLLYACQSKEILQKPIVFDETRRSLTLKYLEEHYGLLQDEPLIEPKMIVIHWTSLGDLESAFKVFQEPVQPRFRNDDPYLPDELNVSAHYLVDQDGTIYQMLPDSIMALHVTGLNYCAIGIKNIGNDQDRPLTEGQLQANVFLVETLTEKYPIEYLIGNSEYPRFQNHPLWKNFSNQPVEKKNDPGEDFMNKLRVELEKLNLSGPPE